jgi:glycosyl transferase, family 25
VHAYVINLARSTDRRSYISAELNKTGIEYEFVTAVDGRGLDLHNTLQIAPAFLDFDFSAGSAGCAFSHLNVYRKILTDGLDHALVLEDDVVVPADLDGLAEAVGRHLTGAEVVLLNFHSSTPCRMSTLGTISLPPDRLLALPIDISQPGSAAAYVITREACERMLRESIPLKVLADAWWHFYRSGQLDRVRCVVPLAVDKNPQFASSIGTYALGEGLKNRLVGPLVHGHLPGVQQALAYRRRRILRRWGRSELVPAPFVEKPSRLDDPH